MISSGFLKNIWISRLENKLDLKITNVIIEHPKSCGLESYLYSFFNLQQQPLKLNFTPHPKIYLPQQMLANPLGCMSQLVLLMSSGCASEWWWDFSWIPVIEPTNRTSRRHTSNSNFASSSCGRNNKWRRLPKSRPQKRWLTLIGPRNWPHPPRTWNADPQCIGPMRSMQIEPDRLSKWCVGWWNAVWR